MALYMKDKDEDNPELVIVGNRQEHVSPLTRFEKDCVCEVMFISSDVGLGCRAASRREGSDISSLKAKKEQGPPYPV